MKVTLENRYDPEVIVFRLKQILGEMEREHYPRPFPKFSKKEKLKFIQKFQIQTLDKLSEDPQVVK